MMVTIFENLYSKAPNHISVDKALDRIKTGRSAEKVAEVRAALDKAKAKVLKEQLPAVTFAGKMAARGDKQLTEHSGFIVLDFDGLDDIGEKAAQMQAFESTYATWVSPSGNGLKVLVKIADGTKHREHFNALREIFPDLDPSGVNEERLCFESHDPHLFRKENVKPFAKVVTTRQVVEKIDSTNGSNSECFQRLMKWIVNKAGVFASGNRNRFVFVLAGACCRFGLDSAVAGQLIAQELPLSNDFTYREMMTAVKSAYKTNVASASTARFEHERMVNITTRKELKISDLPEFDPDAPARDVIYAADVKGEAMKLYDFGFAQLKGVNVTEIDTRWKLKRGEVTGLTGIGNYGKSAFYKWYQLMRILLYGERFASFSPEDNPPAEYYFDFCEILLGCDCTPDNPHRPSREIYDAAYDWIGQHVFYMYPKDDSPTPDYIKARFFEMIVKEKVDGVCIDPFNQMDNDYGGRSDKYLEKVLGSFSRFAQENNVYFVIIVHPKQMTKDANGNYQCPDKFDINDGAMWNNKLDNLLAYHRPFGSTDPDNTMAEFHSKKIRRQKTVGRPGVGDLRYVRHTRRFECGNTDPIGAAINARGLTFGTAITPPPVEHTAYQPKKIELPEGFWDD